MRANQTGVAQTGVTRSLGHEKMGRQSFCVERVRVWPKHLLMPLAIEARCPICGRMSAFDMLTNDQLSTTLNSLVVDLTSLAPEGCPRCIDHCTFTFKASQKMRVVWY